MNRPHPLDSPGWHPKWCARGHRCQLGEHRAEPIAFTVPGAGAAVLTRVRAADGRDHAEIRIRIALAGRELAARRQLATALVDLRTLINRAVTATHRRAA